MKNLLTILLFCFLCLPVFGQMTKESAKEMITGINLQDYNRLFIVTDITASNNPRKLSSRRIYVAYQFQNFKV